MSGSTGREIQGVLMDGSPRRFDGVDSDAASGDERSDYTLARRYMDYEIRGKATDQEVSWLHEHPVLWLRALKTARQEAAAHIQRDKRNLQADPRKPAGDATAETHSRWAQIKADVARATIARETFIIKVKGRLEMVRALLPTERLGFEQVGDLTDKLLGVELLLREGETARALHDLDRIILHLAGEGK